LTSNITNVNSITIGRLRPFRNYTFTVFTKAGTLQTIERRSLPISGIFATKESVPGSLTAFEPYEVQPSKITFKWELPSIEANGVITGFVIEYVQADPPRDGAPSNAVILSQNFEPSDRRGTIEGLVPGVKYAFQIKAKTRVGSGKKKNLYFN
jgi:receptor-type tyrosine-protein phosphatase beta